MKFILITYTFCIKKLILQFAIIFRNNNKKNNGLFREHFLHGFEQYIFLDTLITDITSLLHKFHLGLQSNLFEFFRFAKTEISIRRETKMKQL